MTGREKEGTAGPGGRSAVIIHSLRPYNVGWAMMLLSHVVVASQLIAVTVLLMMMMTCVGDNNTIRSQLPALDDANFRQMNFSVMCFWFVYDTLINIPAREEDRLADRLLMRSAICRSSCHQFSFRSICLFGSSCCWWLLLFRFGYSALICK